MSSFKFSEYTKHALNYWSPVFSSVLTLKSFHFSDSLCNFLIWVLKSTKTKVEESKTHRRRCKEEDEHMTLTCQKTNSIYHLLTKQCTQLHIFHKKINRIRKTLLSFYQNEARIKKFGACSNLFMAV